MINVVKFAGITVKDQDRALEFYTKKLGFEIITDQVMGQGMRWIELRPIGAQTKVAFFMPKGEQDQASACSNVIFACESVEETYEELRQRGVEFTRPPTKESWGTYAQFTDSEGNQFILSSE